MYKILKTPQETFVIQKENCQFFPSTDNKEYQQFLENVAEKGLSIVEGPDLVQPSYSELRLQEYPAYADQFDMIFHEGLDVWKELIQSIKNKYPKTITREVTTQPIPEWVEEDVNKWIFDNQLKKYTEALINLPEYILNNERPEVDTEEYQQYKDYLDIIDNTPEEIEKAYKSLFTPDRVIVNEFDTSVKPDILSPGIPIRPEPVDTTE